MRVIKPLGLPADVTPAVPAAPLATDGETRLADVGQGERAVAGHREFARFFVRWVYDTLRTG
jgi:hypothetical protein